MPKPMNTKARWLFIVFQIKLVLACDGSASKVDGVFQACKAQNTLFTRNKVLVWMGWVV